MLCPRPAYRSCLIAAAALALSCTPADRTTDDREARPQVGQPVDADALQATHRALEYLHGRGTSFTPMMGLVAAYVQRRFGVVELQPFANLVGAAGNTPEGPLVKALGRLVDPRTSMNRDEIDRAAQSETDGAILAALYCDKNGIDPAWDERIAGMAAEGGYSLTHAAMGLQWMQENHCGDPSRVAELNRDLSTQLVELAEKMGAADLGMEAIAMLYYGGHRDLVRRDWIRMVTAAQRPDGGWGVAPLSAQGVESNDHSTVLGLWVMFEATYPAAPAVSWVCH